MLDVLVGWGYLKGVSLEQLGHVVHGMYSNKRQWHPG